jgi:PleD family two-component response regulator
VPTPDSAPEHERGVVLLVEHDRSRLQHLDMMLSARGYTVVSMTRALVQLTRLARALRPRAILLDSVSEGVDNIVRELADSSEFEQIPVLVFSRNSDAGAPGTFERAVDADLVGFVERQRERRQTQP